MSAFWGQLAGVITITLMLVFLVIWAWAWLPRHKGTFDALAKLPMEDEIPSTRGDAR